MSRSRRLPGNQSVTVMLIVQDARLRRAIRTGIEGDQRFKVIAEAGDPVEAAMAWTRKPDVIIRDAHVSSTNLQSP